MKSVVSSKPHSWEVEAELQGSIREEEEDGEEEELEAINEEKEVGRQ